MSRTLGTLFAATFSPPVESQPPARLARSTCPALADAHAAFDPTTHRFFVVANVLPTSSVSFDGVSIQALAADGAPR